MSYLDTEQFIREFNAGSDQAFEEMYKAHSPLLYAFTVKIIRDSEEAEDITAETFFKVHRSRGQFKTLNSIRAFLYTTARNACIDYLRRTKVAESVKRTFRLTAETFMPANDELDGIYYSVLKKAIDKLPPRQKEVIEKLYLEDFSHQEVAEQMEVKIETVYSLRSRALTILRDVMSSQHNLAQDALLCSLLMLLILG